MDEISLTVFYDGLCPICSKEINTYKKWDDSNLLQLIDISNPEFNAKDYDLNSNEVHEVFHVKDQNGDVFTGVDGFVKIWETLDIFSPLQKVAGSSIGRPVLEFGYKAFARHIRPRITRSQCNGEVCTPKV
ncbi:MAG: hypothetical protein CL677_08120 [Bdellovibrionaceae bacterium]|nr:hypothetical protein [Pseudobdellovibrionaceae bacterium]|tara:strand:+ start:79818 stop:80210 length:393 start_codon:yes stop_codon:yes gene_type:complete